jgi:hypothetical protein
LKKDFVPDVEKEFKRVIKLWHLKYKSQRSFRLMNWSL